MNQLVDVENSQYQKRPLILSFFCVLYLFTFLWNLVELLIPSGYSTAITKLPTWFVIVQVTILYPIGIGSTLGVWFMRRWGFFAFCVVTLLSWLLMIFGLNLLPRPRAVLLALTFFITGIIYLPRMK